MSKTFDKKFRLEKKLALLEAEKQLLLTCSTDVMLKAYIWYSKRKCFMYVIKSVVICFLSVVSPTAVIGYIKAEFGGM